MPNTLIIDNWTLQDVESLLSEGLRPFVVGEIDIPSDATAHTFRPIQHGVIQIDALLTLLTNVVCHDHLQVDKNFTYAWERAEGKLAPLASLGIVQATDNASLSNQLHELRSVLIDELCVTPTLKEDVKRIQRHWEQFKESPDPHLSALVLGGAGMLARSALTGNSYFGHPVRRSLIRHSRVFASTSSSVERLNTFLDENRSKMFRFRSSQLSGTIGQVALSPFPVQIIEEAGSVQDLIQVALQLRAEHQKLRDWLREYQVAINEEDERKQIRFEKALRSVAASVQARYGASKAGSVGVSISATWLKLDVPQTLIDRARNSFGVRATLTDLLLSGRGQQALTKLLKLLDANHTKLGREVEAACRARYSTKAGFTET